MQLKHTSSSLMLVLLLAICMCSRSAVAKEEGNSGPKSMLEALDENDSTPLPEQPEICGPYGFRCLDDKTFQVCRHIDLDGNKEEAPELHDCKPDLVCDEENIAYCTPKFRLIDTTGEGGEGGGSKGRCESSESEPDWDLSLGVGRKRRIARHSEKSFKCKKFGFYADHTNHSMFWFCDRGHDGITFQQRHMLCANGRIFDSNLNDCVLIQITSYGHKPPAPKPEPVKMEFSCTGRAAGKYSDSADCQKYHLCLPTSKNGHNQLVFECPRGTAYDVKLQLCNESAHAGCKEDGDEDNEAEPDDEPCETGARVQDSGGNCEGYSLCVGKTSIAMRCPDNHRFDAKLKLCKPEEEVTC